MQVCYSSFCLHHNRFRHWLFAGRVVVGSVDADANFACVVGDLASAFARVHYCKFYIGRHTSWCLVDETATLRRCIETNAKSAGIPYKPALSGWNCFGAQYSGIVILKKDWDDMCKARAAREAHKVKQMRVRRRYIARTNV
jgi:hypothetical protein